MKTPENEINTSVLMIIKPDGCQQLPKIMQTLMEFKISVLSMKLVNISEDQAKSIYNEHEGKYFYQTLVEYITMAPCFVLAIQGQSDNIIEAKKSLRELAKDIAQSKCNESLVHFLGGLSCNEKVKADLGELSRKFNAEFVKTFDGIHASDIENGNREIAIFFNDQELIKHEFNPKIAGEIIKGKLMKTAVVHIKPIFDDFNHQANNTLNN